MQGAKGCDIPPSIADLGGMTALPGQLRRLDIAMLLARNGAANEGGRTRLKKDLYMFDVQGKFGVIVAGDRLGLVGGVGSRHLTERMVVMRGV